MTPAVGSRFCEGVVAASAAIPKASLNASADPHHSEELDEASLQTISGGATALEYGLIASGISLAIIATVQTLGPKLGHTFTNVAAELK